MTVLVLDASVLVKWYVPELHTEAARRLLQAPEMAYVAPELIFAEAANAVWKKTRRGEIPHSLAVGLVTDMCRADVETVPLRSLVADAYALAAHTNRTVYDCCYLALAARLRTELVTADQRLYHALRNHGTLGKHLRWIETAL
jgi:predicted nucleic acid-binding protein